MAGLLEVEVVYALPDEQYLERLEVPAGSTVGDVIRCSGLAAAYPAVDFAESDQR